MKLTKKEKEKIKRQMSTHDRGNSWVGIRPVVFKSKKHDKKLRRRISKSISKDLN